jgi:predicted amidohydrolase YtcJ
MNNFNFNLRLFTLLLLVLGMGCKPQSGQNVAAKVVYHAQIYTVNAKQATAEAMAIGEDGKILQVGTTDEILKAYPNAEKIDAQGKTVIPGLIDAHAHLMGLGTSLLNADLVGTKSVAEVIERLKAFEKNLPEGAWLIGRGWDQNDWQVKKFPTAKDLDEAFPKRMVWLRRIDGHAAWGNSATLSLLGETFSKMPDPSGGKVMRDGVGNPTGVLVDNAMDLIDTKEPPMTPELLQKAMTLAIDKCKSLGLTGVHDAGVDMATIKRYEKAIADDRFDLRVYGMIGGAGEALDYIIKNGFIMDEGNKLTVRSLKLYADGALGSRGAAMLQPYSDDPHNHGLMTTKKEDFVPIVKRAMQAKLQVGTHAIGDAGNRMVMDGYEEAIKATSNQNGRHRVEHAQVVSLDDIPRFKQMGIIASMQPTHATSDMPWAEDRVGKERIKGAYAWRRFLDQGTVLAFGSDFPVEEVNPLLGFYAAITRQDADGNPPVGWLPDQILTRAETLKAFTLDAAYAAFQEKELGSIEVGKWADFVIFDKNIMTVSPKEILSTKVVATYLGGKKVFGK